MTNAILPLLLKLCFSNDHITCLKIHTWIHPHTHTGIMRATLAFGVMFLTIFHSGSLSFSSGFGLYQLLWEMSDSSAANCKCLLSFCCLVLSRQRTMGMKSFFCINGRPPWEEIGKHKDAGRAAKQLAATHLKFSNMWRSYRVHCSLWSS